MTAPLAIGYTALTAIVLSALVLFDVIAIPIGDPAVAFNIAGAAFIFSYVGLWAWMLIDHLVNGGPSHTVLISIFLVFGGGLAGIAYFFLVFRHRHTTAYGRGGG